MSTPAPDSRVPEKPTLDGLEERWAQVWATQGTYRFDRTQDRGARSSRSTRRRRRCRVAAHRARVLLHPHRHHRPLPAHARARRSSTRWAGTTTACPPSGACRTTSTCAATRRCPTTRRSSRPTEPPKQARCRSAAPQLHRAVRAAHRRGREGLRGAVAPARAVGRLVADLRDDRRALAAGSPSGRSCATCARGEVYQTEAPTLWDVDFRTAVAQAELEDRERPGAYHRTRLPPAPTAAATCSSTPPGPSCSPPAWRSSPTPTTSATSRCSAPRSRTPLFGVEVPIFAHELADPEKGTGIAMICTFGDLTDVIWWRELRACRPAPSSAGTAASCADAARVASPTDDGARRLRRLAGKTVVHRARSASSSCSPRIGRPRRRAAPDHAPGEVLREGRPAARDRHDAPVVHPQRRPRRELRDALLAARRRARVAPAVHAGALRELGGGPQRRLADHAASASSACRSRSGIRSTPQGEPDYDDAASWPTRRRCPSIRRPTCRPAHATTSAASPAASSATPTSWTPGPPRR